LILSLVTHPKDEPFSCYNRLFSSVISVFSDVTTSHSTKLAKNTSQVAGYVANYFFKITDLH